MIIVRNISYKVHFTSYKFTKTQTPPKTLAAKEAAEDSESP